jgi:hypothetical protein
MTLVPDPDQAGRWNSVDRSNAGVHALIIGISEYSYLSGGSASKLASDTGGMGQLRVSALTAAKVFHWLINASEVVGASLVTCRLHLAPCREELEKVTLLTNGHYASADFATIRTAIEGWADDIFAGAQVAKPNVALFFFSGHGVEILSSPALLASDILNPRSASAASNAVAIESLLRAIKTCGIDRGLFFVDACRDAPTLARVLNITGEDVLKPQAYPPKIPDALISLQSTRSGLQSFQAPEDEATIFGRALLEGLHGLPPTHVPYDTMVSPWKLLFRNLESHVKHGVRELLCRHSALKIQSVEPYGNPYNGDMVVAQKIGVLAPASSNLQGGDLQGKALLRDELVASSSEQLLKGFESVYENDLHQTGAAGGMLVVANDLYNPAIMQDLFADKDITSLWIDTVEIIDGRTNKAASSDTLNLVGGKRQRVGDSITVWADLLVAAGAGDSVWVKAKGAGDRPSFLLHLPRDAQQPIPVRIDIGLRGNPGRGYIIEALSARLSDPGDHFAGPISEIWRKLWEAQRSELLDNLGCAGAELIESRVVEKAMRSEGGSPVGAAIAITLLLRCGAIEPLNDWPRKLAVRSPWLPDGPKRLSDATIKLESQRYEPARPDLPAWKREAR